MLSQGSRQPNRLSHSRLTLEAIGESGWLERVGRMLGAPAGAPPALPLAGVVVGFGDDAACLAVGDRLVLVTTDVLIEGTHFTRRTIAPGALGEKAVAVNVSDIAAMGGRPTALTVGLGAHGGLPVTWLEAVFAGMARACRRWGIAFAGGDTVRSERVVLAVTLLGEFDGPAERLPLRRRIRAGQRLYVTGTLGDSGAGLALLQGGRPKARGIETWRGELIARHQRPVPRLAEGQALVRAFDDLAMIDLSDDLWKSVNLMAEAGGVGIGIQTARLPLSGALRRFARATGGPALEQAVFGGEDFELLFATAAAPQAVALSLGKAGLKTPVRAIGRATADRRVRWLDRAGREVKWEGRAFEHFGRREE